MTFRKSNVYLNLVNSYLIDSPQPSSINYWWNLGSLLGLCLVIQIITGIFIAIHYSSNIELAFNSVEHIMRDVNNGWLIRYFHANGASFFFLTIYAHIGKGLYYGSYKSPRYLVWLLGVIIFVATMATAFLGYCCVYGQMSHWGALVITNLFSAIPFIGNDIVLWLWGGFSVSNPLIVRFFALHYLLPFIIAALVIMHLIALHVHGSSNPLGITGNVDRLPIHNYFIFKDLITIFVFLILLSLFVFYSPNTLGQINNGKALIIMISLISEVFSTKYFVISTTGRYNINVMGTGIICDIGYMLFIIILYCAICWKFLYQIYNKSEYYFNNMNIFILPFLDIKSNIDYLYNDNMENNNNYTNIHIINTSAFGCDISDVGSIIINNTEKYYYKGNNQQVTKDNIIILKNYNIYQVGTSETIRTLKTLLSIEELQKFINNINILSKLYNFNSIIQKIYIIINITHDVIPVYRTYVVRIYIFKRRY